MRILLLPISFFYHIMLIIRHKLYDWHLLKSKKFDQPVIGVGNLSLGGTGKTPHVEYLVRLLSAQYRVCVVSRGYGRKTKGFQLANDNCAAETVGDEPLQYVFKFDDAMVAVDENRNRAIELMNTLDRPPELCLLDDAYQHRSTQAGLNILLTAYDKLYCDDLLVPAGTLRDVRSAAKRADIIVVSKSPTDMDEAQRSSVVERLRPLPHQRVFFSYLEHEPLKPLTSHGYDPSEAESALLFCGIAKPEPLVKELQQRFSKLETMTFRDHHPYSESDMRSIVKRFEHLDGANKIIVTTEKDAARLKNSPYLCQFESMPLFVAPIKVRFYEEEKFNEAILSYVRKNHQNR